MAFFEKLNLDILLLIDNSHLIRKMIMGLLCISILISTNKTSVSLDEPYVYWQNKARTDIGNLYKIACTQGSPCTNEDHYIVSIYTFPDKQGFLVDIVDYNNGYRDSLKINSWNGDVDLATIRLFNTKFYFIENLNDSYYLVCTSLYLKENWKYKLSNYTTKNRILFDISILYVNVNIDGMNIILDQENGSQITSYPGDFVNHHYFSGLIFKKNQ